MATSESYGRREPHGDGPPLVAGDFHFTAVGRVQMANCSAVQSRRSFAAEQELNVMDRHRFARVSWRAWYGVKQNDNSLNRILLLTSVHSFL